MKGSVFFVPFLLNYPGQEYGKQQVVELGYFLSSTKLRTVMSRVMYQLVGASVFSSVVQIRKFEAVLAIFCQ